MPAKLDITEDERKARLRQQKRDYMRRVRKEQPEKIKVWDEHSKELRTESAKVWKKENPARVKAHTEKTLTKDPEYFRRKAKERYWENPEKYAEQSRLWAKNNPEKVKAYRNRTKDRAVARCRQRQALLLKRMPPWADKNAINKLYSECRRITESTGIPHEVDHIYPLRGALVSGLHHQDNLQIITKTANRKKGRKMPCR